MRALLLVAIVASLASCWREAPPPSAPQPSFVARVNALAELRRSAEALEPRLEAAMHRILGLASDRERDAIRLDLDGLDHEIALIARYVDAARARGDDPRTLDDVDQKLARVRLGLANLREELAHAKTLAERAALKKIDDDSHDEDIRIRLYRQRDSLPIDVFERRSPVFREQRRRPDLVAP